MSLDEAYIVLGVEGGAQHDDSAIMVAYDELVLTGKAQSYLGQRSTCEDRGIQEGNRSYRRPPRQYSIEDIPDR